MWGCHFPTTTVPDAKFDQVFAPAASDAKSMLPVLVWIHGGAYGQGSGSLDLTALITNNNNSFIGVTLQYRVSHAATLDDTNR